MQLGIPANKIRVIYHGGPAQVGSERKRSSGGRFIFVSNITRYKNVHTLVRALSRVRGSWSLNVVGGFGERDYESELRDLMQELGLTARVRFLGAASGAEVARLYNNADLFVWPSYAETFGHPLLEAYAHGLPVIAADSASNREILGEGGRYFDPNDVAGLATLLQEALSQDVVPGPLPRSYSWDRCAEETARYLAELA